MVSEAISPPAPDSTKRETFGTAIATYIVGSIPGILNPIPAFHVADVATCHGYSTRIHVETCARALGLVDGAIARWVFFRLARCIVSLDCLINVGAA